LTLVDVSLGANVSVDGDGDAAVTLLESVAVDTGGRPAQSRSVAVDMRSAFGRFVRAVTVDMGSAALR